MTYPSHLEALVAAFPDAAKVPGDYVHALLRLEAAILKFFAAIGGSR